MRLIKEQREAAAPGPERDRGAADPSEKSRKTGSVRPFRKIWNAVTTVILAAAVLLAVLLAGVRVAGLQVFQVMSGSMEPVYPVGSLIYVKKQAPSGLEIGDDITYRMGKDMVVTHRIVGIFPREEDPSKLCFQTKGLANGSPDAALVQEQQLIGKAVFGIPYLGKVFGYLRQPPGLYVVLAGTALFLILPELFTGKTPRNKKESDPNQS